MRDCPLVVRILNEIGLALLASWVVLAFIINDQNSPLLLYMIIGIGIVFVPIWLFAFLGTNLVYTLPSTQSNRWFNKGDIGLWIISSTFFFMIMFRNLILIFFIVFLGLFFRLSNVIQNQKRVKKEDGAEGEICSDSGKS